MTAIRIAALCLAGEADGGDRADGKDLGNLFRQVAAGITLLEQRYSGERPATEVILLAAGQERGAGETGRSVRD